MHSIHAKASARAAVIAFLAPSSGAWRCARSRRGFALIIVLASLILITLAAPLSAQQPLPVRIGAEDPLVLYSGRRDDTQKGAVMFGYSGARIRTAFTGESIGMWMDSPNPNWVNIYVDGKRISKIKVSGEGGYYELVSGLSKAKHTVEVIRATEANQSLTIFKGFALPEGARTESWPEKDARKIEFVGDSITCGYGIEVSDPKLHFAPDTENFCDTYAFIAAQNLKADFLVVACSGIGMLRNFHGPVDGSKNNMFNLYDATFYKMETPHWDFSRYVPDVVCINLCTNDFSPDGPNKEKFEANYIEFLKKMVTRYPSARIVVLQGPMQNTATVREILNRIVETMNQGTEKKAFYFQMSKGGAHGFGADYHPSQEQAKINGAELTTFLSELMHW
ncbi:MAG: SGNH/GDSL hydrolase family protein [Candidatus Methylacidiphilales bacterium]|nr:SGNH/GDSL hydrolase family protein [Candidatus Methylacidiphilales bacterium]